MREEERRGDLAEGMKRAVPRFGSGPVPIFNSNPGAGQWKGRKWPGDVVNEAPCQSRVFQRPATDAGDPLLTLQFSPLAPHPSRPPKVRHVRQIVQNAAKEATPLIGIEGESEGGGTKAGSWSGGEGWEGRAGVFWSQEGGRGRKQQVEEPPEPVDKYYAPLPASST